MLLTGLTPVVGVGIWGEGMSLAGWNVSINKYTQYNKEEKQSAPIATWEMTK